MNLSEAKTVANHLVDFMRPWCEQIEIAGSIRREVPVVKDVELVCVPKWENAPATEFRPDQLFEISAPLPVNLLHRWAMTQDVVQWIKPGTSDIIPWRVTPEGKYWHGLTGFAEGAERIKLDLFLARPENFGVIYTIRTGSADFSRELVTYARDHTIYRVQEGYLVDDRQLGRPKIVCPDEETLFGLLNLEWIEPRARGGKRDLVRLSE